MTYGEIIDTIKAFNNVNQNRLKERAIMDYRLADLISSCIGRLFSEDAKTPSLTDAYEFLFQKEKKLQDEIKVKNEMEVWKQRMINFTKNHNRKWGENN